MFKLNPGPAQLSSRLNGLSQSTQHPRGLLEYKREGVGGGGGRRIFLGITFSIPVFLGVEDLTVYFFGSEKICTYFFGFEFLPG